MTKRVLSVLLALCLVMGMVPVFAAAEVVDSGTCGDNLTWTFDGTTLTISGTGDMGLFGWAGGFGATTPWHDYRDQIQTVIIKSGVTNISGLAFDGLFSLPNITIPASVTRIESLAFSRCTALTKITIPASVTSIGRAAFGNCRNLKDVYYSGTEKDWAKIDIDKSTDDSPIFWGCNNDYLLNATIHFAKDSGTTPTFKDVPAGQYYAAPVAWAVGQGITKGTGKNTFSPEAKIKRQDVVTFLWRANGKPEPKTTKNPFTDIKEGDYYYKAVLWAVEEKITTGTGKNTFSPAKVCTRKEIATFLWRDAGKTPPQTAKNPFADVKPGDYYYEAVLWAVENKITKGTGKNTFSPGKDCTRGQTVTFLYRVKN